MEIIKTKLLLLKVHPITTEKPPGTLKAPIELSANTIYANQWYIAIGLTFIATLLSYLVVLVLSADSVIIMGIPPTTLTLSSSSQGLSISNYVLVVPIATVLVITMPWLLKRARKARLQLALMYQLRSAVKSGTSLNTLIETTLRLTRLNLITFTTERSMSSILKSKTVPVVLEDLVWATFGTFLTILITSSFLVLKPGLTTDVTGSSFISIQNASATVYNSNCLANDWAQNALNNSMNQAFYNTESNQTTGIIYGLIPPTNTSFNTGYGFVAVGYGSGLSIWTSNTTDKWYDATFTPPWDIVCNQNCTIRGTYSKGIFVISANAIRRIFETMALLDEDLKALIGSGSLSQDAIITKQGLVQAISYATLTSQDVSALSNTYRAAYIMSKACSIPSTTSISSSLGSFVSFNARSTRPVLVLNRTKILWYASSAPALISSLVIITAILATLPYFLIFLAWYKSDFIFWFPVSNSCTNHGPHYILRKLGKFTSAGSLAIRVQEDIFVKVWTKDGDIRFSMSGGEGWELASASKNKQMIRGSVNSR